jgi:hypothetical protein
MRVVVGVLVLAAASTPARACPEAGFGNLFSNLDLGGTNAPVNEPVVIPSAGASSNGWGYGVSIGWARGERQVGGWFPDTSTRRVLLHVRRTSRTSDLAASARTETEPEMSTRDASTHVGVTYGLFSNVPGLFDAGLDVGVAGSSFSQLGPVVHLTGGRAGIGLRLSGGAEFGDDTRLTGAAELVVDVVVLGRTLAR